LTWRCSDRACCCSQRYWRGSLRGCVCPGFVAVAEPVLSGVCSPCLQVATQAAHAATALLRVNHQSSPVQYKELEDLVEDIIARCTELPLPASSRCRVSLKGAEPSSQASRAGGFLLQALVCFHAACRLVEQCSSEPGLKENVFTAPSKQVRGLDPLEPLCLLHCCDTVCIPIVTRHCEPPAPRCSSTSSPSCHTSSPFYPLRCRTGILWFLQADSGAQSCPLCRKPVTGEPEDTHTDHYHPPRQKPSSECSLLWFSAEAQCVSSVPTRPCSQHPPTRLLPDSTVFSCVVTLLCSVQEQGFGATSLCAQVCPLPAVCHTGQEPRPGLGSSKLHQQGPVLQP
uniref:Uncharacterized protein n=1 Tax=Hucho hucho TaxID=62062 RepID=A0A4W5PL27_9TELE